MTNGSQMQRQAGIAFLTHADSDLLLLSQARKLLPQDFPHVLGYNLQNLSDEGVAARFMEEDLSTVRIVLMRVLGRPDGIPGLADLLKLAALRRQHLIIVSGAGELSCELLRLSSVARALVHDVLVYLENGGTANMASVLRYLCDQLLGTSFGYDRPVALPEHGIYHRQLPRTATIDDWLAWRNKALPSVGITFYRAHWLSGNTAFIDELVDCLERRKMNVLAVFTSSLRALSDKDAQMPSAFRFFHDGQAARVDAIINTTSFAMGDIKLDGLCESSWSTDCLSAVNVPVIQATPSSMTQDQWENSARGLGPVETTMNVIMPEFDGRITAVPFAFREASQSALVEGAVYKSLCERAGRVAGIAQRLVELRCLGNESKRIAFVFTNSNSKASQIGNAVGLDAPASLMRIMEAMQAAGYSCGRLPCSSDRLIHDLIDAGSYDQDYLTAAQCQQAIGRIPSERYCLWYRQLPLPLREAIEAQWGPPPGKAYVQDDHLIVAGLQFGNQVVILQPPRGYGMDPDAIYHRPDLPPTHHYMATYLWLRDGWGANAIVHVGKHGTLEWLPGKSVGLSENCFPDALLQDMPLFYPFILNDPGEGCQAKRRAHAVIVDHLTPPMTTADTYGVLSRLVQLVDEYYQVEMLDPCRLPLLQEQIWDLIKQANLVSDLQYILSHDHHDESDHGDDLVEDDQDGDHHLDHVLATVGEKSHGHTEELERELACALTPGDNGVPASLTKMGGFDVAHMIQELDGYLCELGAAQIRDGLHILGAQLEGETLVDMLLALTRLPNLLVPGLHAELGRLFGLPIDDLLEKRGRRLSGVPKILTDLARRPLVTASDVLEIFDDIGRGMLRSLQSYDFAVQRIDDVLAETLGCGGDLGPLREILLFVCQRLVRDLGRTGEEIDNLLRGLAGQYVPPGPSGAPTRGMAHILPTGRNFYSVDPLSLPSQAAWRVGQQLCNEVLRRHRKESGCYPESVSISVWGTSAMRTHGDDVAEILALLGVRPVWEPGSRRVRGIEVIQLAELGRPRIDATIRVSGFFRDAFPNLIALIDEAVSAVIAQDEPAEMNFVRKHYIADVTRRLLEGESVEAASRRGRYRVFGSKPGSYGAGILPLINERNWSTEADFAEAFVNWGGFAYTRLESGVDARDDFRRRLSSVQVALHNQDNSEHDIFDSDDYFQFHGGMIATISSLTGKRPRHYFGDTHDGARARVRDLKEETLRVFRSRVVNPKWLESIRRHGYKGGLELTATVDYLFGYDATACVLEDWMYEQVAQHYAIDPQMRQFLNESNPWALNAIAERLLEAAQRKLWRQPAAESLAALEQALLSSEALLESRGEKPRLAGGVL